MNNYVWQNELTDSFMKDGYLLPNQTLDERVNIICNRAEEILQKPGFGAKFKENLQKGWYSLSTPIWSNFGTNRGLSISCVVGDTWINTKINGGKQARDIALGDQVLTHKGRYRKVINIIKTENRSDIYKLKVSSRMTNLYLTGDHLVLTNLGWVRTDELDKNMHLVAVNNVIEYTEEPYVIDLSDYIKYEFVEIDGKLCKPGSKTVRQDRQKEIVSSYSQPYKNIEIDEDLAWAIGLWFAEGSLAVNNRKEPNGIRITVGTHEKELAERWMKIITEKFNLNGNLYNSSINRHGKENTWISVNINSGVIGSFFESFGCGCKEKTIPEYIMNLPKNLLSEFLNGILEGDGSDTNRNSSKITLANPKLILQLYQIGLKLGLDMSLQMQEKAGKLATVVNVYTVIFRNLNNENSRKYGIRFQDGLIYNYIQTIEKTEKVETVYDFTVEEDHSFSAAGVILHNCFGSYMDDTMESILSTNTEVGMMTKYGGGTSAYFGKLRPRGSEIKNNGKSSGSVHFMKIFETTMTTISQGSTRRGSFAAYLDIDHHDIEEFLEIRSEGHPIQDISFGVCVPDYWMEEMINGDVRKRKIWAKVLESRSNTGYPYIHFIDNANNNAPDVYKDKGMRIYASNLCVSGNQRIPTNYGLLTAKELYELGIDLLLFDNDKIIKSSPMKLIEENADVIKITLDNGMSHIITPYHKLKTSEYNHHHKEVVYIKQCKDLKIGDRVAIQTNKSNLFGSLSMPEEAFLLGLYQSDGTQHKDIIMLDIWENDFDIVDEIQESFNKIHYKYGCGKYTITNQYGTSFEKQNSPAKFHECNTGVSKVRKKRLVSKTLKKSLNFEKGYIPNWIWESDEKTQWQYIRGLLYADGTVYLSDRPKKGDPIQISYADINKEFLEELQILFANLGLQTSIRILREEGLTLLPDGKGSSKYYNTKTCWRLICGNKNDALTIEKNTGFLSRKNIKLEDRKYRDNTKKYYKIESIEYLGKEDVYCVKVDSEDHLWVCNGIITHNCDEINLPSSIDESFVCDLSSMNVLYFDQWKNTDAVELLTYFLDAVMSDFIEKAENIKFMERAVKFAKRHRALGIGWLGWHSYLQSKMISFESLEAKLHNTLIAQTIKDQANEASKKLAKEYGEPELLKGYGRRNTTLLAIAPTKSSAFILGQVSEGIEPNRTNYYIKDLQKGKYTIKNPYLVQLLEDKNKNNEEVWKSILMNSGSVQHLEFLSQTEKDVFKTFSEISPKEIIIQASARQKFIDQGQSLNLMIHPSIPIKDINALMIEAWRLGVKGLYYQISVNAAQEFSRNILNCVSCEA